MLKYFLSPKKNCYKKEKEKEKEKEKKIAKKKTKSKKNKLDSTDYVQKYLFWDNLIFAKNNPTTFKKLTFKKEKKTADVYKKVKYSDKWNKKKILDHLVLLQNTKTILQ